MRTCAFVKHKLATYVASEKRSAPYLASSDPFHVYQALAGESLGKKIPLRKQLLACCQFMH